MTTGELMFYGGAALLCVTILLAIFFLIKKPRYDPEHGTYSVVTPDTQPLRNSYPTDPLTRGRKEPQGGSETVSMENQETALLTSEQGSGANWSGTVLLRESDETRPLN